MTYVVDIYTEYKCKKGHKWHKYWRSRPWFGDFTTRCPECGLSAWFSYKYDNSGERDEPWEQRWQCR